MIKISNIKDVRFAFYLVEPVGFEDALEYGVKSESWGYDAVAACDNTFWYTPEQSPVWHNPTLLTTIMARTKRIKIITNVLDPVKRHPALVAHMVSTLDNIGKGRFTFGIGPGEIGNYGPLVDLVGARPHRLFTRTKEYIEVMQGIWNSTLEKPFNYNGRFFRLKNAFLSLKSFTKPHPPIYVAGLGPKMRQLTGEMADGWLPLTYTPETYKKDWIEIEKAAKSIGRDINKIDPCLSIYTAVLRDSDRATEIATSRGRLDMTGRPRLLKELGFSDLADSSLGWSNRSGPLVEKEREKEVMERIPKEIAIKVNISGSPDDAINQIEDFIKAGVKLFILWPPYEEKDVLKETIQHYKNKILPYFKNL